MSNQNQNQNQYGHDYKNVLVIVFTPEDQKDEEVSAIDESNFVSTESSLAPSFRRLF